MSTDPNDLLPSAKDCMKKIAEAEAEKASEYMRRQAAAEAEKRALMERFEKPSGVSDDERLKRAAAIYLWDGIFHVWEPTAGRHDAGPNRGRAAISSRPAGHPRADRLCDLLLPRETFTAASDAKICCGCP